MAEEVDDALRQLVRERFRIQETRSGSPAILNLQCSVLTARQVFEPMI